MKCSGFSSIGLLSAISLGAVVSLGYINLSHYFVARAALERAAREAVRCVAPTDGACAPSLSSQGQPRWRYEASFQTPRGDVVAAEYDYSAQMRRQRFRAEHSVYRTEREEAPSVRVETYKLPTAQYRSTEPAKQVLLTYVYDATTYRRLAIPKNAPFPAFDSDFERRYSGRAFLTSADDSSLSDAQRSVRRRFKPILSSSFRLRISGAETERDGGRFYSRVSIAQGLLPLRTLLEGEEVSDSCKPGAFCSVRAAAGSAVGGTPEDFKQDRFLALYLQVRVEGSKGTGEIAIKGREDSGFRLRNGQERVCLGGRDFTPISELSGGYFNLWMRGPAGATGGDSGGVSCAAGEYRLSSLSVPIDGSFAPEVSLALRGKMGDEVRGEVTVYAFADSYDTSEVKEQKTYRCESVIFKHGVSVTAQIPKPEACGVPSNAEVSPARLEAVSEKFVGCLDEPASVESNTLLPSSFSIGDALSGEPVPSVVKSYQGSSCSLPESFCPWKKVAGTDGNVVVGGVSLAECPQAVRGITSLPCLTEDAPQLSCDIQSLTADRCPRVVSFFQDLKKIAEAQALPVTASFSVRGEVVRGASLKPSFGCLQQLSSDGQRECGIREIASIMTEPEWLRRDKGWLPTEQSAYKLSEGIPWCGVSAVTPVGESEVVDISGYPFDGNSNPELSLQIPKQKEGRLICEESESPVSLESILRSYAVLNGASAAADPSIEFSYQAVPLGSVRLLARQIGCQSSVLHKSEGCERVTLHSDGTELCGRTNLGEIENEPEICKRPGVVCHRSFLGFGNDERPKDIQAEEDVRRNAQAEDLAQQILRRYLPHSLASCEAASCIETIVTLDKDKTVSATASYHLPLSWPLNELLKRDSIKIATSRTERVESL